MPNVRECRTSEAGEVLNIQSLAFFLLVCLILVLASFVVPEGSGVACFVIFIFGVVIGAYAMEVGIRERYEKGFEKMLAEDEVKFAMVVKEFYQNDPILTTGVWKKVHPQIVPPWHRRVHQQPEEEQWPM